MKTYTIYRCGMWFDYEHTLKDAKESVLADVYDREVCGQAPVNYEVFFKGDEVWRKDARKMAPNERRKVC